MKKLLLLFLLSFFGVSSLQAKADIYLATGVLTTEKSTDEARKALEADLKAANPEIYGSDPFKSAYNTTHGLWDFIEAAAQLFDQNGWSKYWQSFSVITNQKLAQHFIDYFSGLSQNHSVDINEQITNYANSINAGNQVIVIAHSQGNYFTNQAYEALNDCQKKSFYMLGTANPASKVSGMEELRGALATLDNDPITYVPSSMSANIINSERYTLNNGYYEVDFKLAKFHFFDYYQNKNSVTRSKIFSFPEYAIDHYEKNMNAVASSGPVEVSLTWRSPNINMDLGVAWGAGIYDVKDICDSQEHYVIASEDDVEVGVYPVFIGYNGGAVEDDYPQNVSLNIKALKESKTFNFTFTELESLQSLHVANIVIKNSQDGSPEAELVVSNRLDPNSGSSNNGSSGILGTFCPIDGCAKSVFSSAGTASANQGGNYFHYNGVTYRSEPNFNLIVEEDVEENNETSSTGAEDTLYAEVVSQLNQAVAGPLSGASITLYEANDISKQPIYSGNALSGRSLLTAGVILLPRSVTTALSDESIYVLEARGGLDMDVDDDGLTDIFSTENYGSLHAILNGKAIKEGSVKVTILSEIAYQVTKSLFDTNDSAKIDQHLEFIATRVLKESLDGDDNITGNDLLRWIPSQHKNKLVREYNLIENMLAKVRMDDDIYQEAYDYVYMPYMPAFSFSFDENITSGSIVGFIDYDQKEVPIETYRLVGQNSNYFTIDSSGAIRVSDEAIIDYEKISSYDFTLIASNALGDFDSRLLLQVNNILDAPELKDFVASVAEHSAPGTAVGTIEYSEGTSEITSFTLLGSGHENFEIDLNGTITVADGAILDYESSVYFYKLKVVATNDAGTSLAKDVVINITNILDNPELSLFKGNVPENSPAGTVIGTIGYNEGSSPITSFKISLEGSENFNIDINGVVSVAENAILDYEGVNRFKFKVVATNLSGDSLPGVIDISLLDVADAPMLSNLMVTTTENRGSGIILGTVPVISTGADIFQFSLTGQGSELFDITMNGDILIKEGQNVDFETSDSYILHVIATNEYGNSQPVDVNITIENIIDPPTLYDTTLSVNEHSPIGTILGQIEISQHQDCAITSYSVGSIYSWQHQPFNIDNSGVIYVAESAQYMDYEHTHGYVLNIVAHSECGESNAGKVTISINDLDENAEVGFGIMAFGYATIYQIEQNGSLTQQYQEHVSLNNNHAIFNTHKYELKPDAYYLMEAANGSELDIDTNGVIEWSNRLEFKGKMRAIVKGSWLFDIPIIRLSPISEMVVDALDLQSEKYDPETLETQLDSAAKHVVRTDIDSDGEITILDALQYNGVNVYDSYTFLGDIKTVVNGGAAIGDSIGSVPVFDIHGGFATSLTLSGVGSEYFTLGTQNSLIVNDSLFDQAGKIFEFSTVTTDENNVTSVGNITVTVAPSMYLLSSYVPSGGSVNKIEATKDGKLLFAAAGEAGVVILNSENPTSPQLVAQFIDELDINGSGIDVTSIALSHDEQTLFVTEAEQGRLIVLDVSDPTHYHQISVLSITSEVHSLREVFVSADDRYVYVAGDMLEIIDASNKLNLQLVSHFDIFSEIWGDIYGLELSPDATKVSVIYREYEDVALRSVDVSNPNTPKWVESTTYQRYMFIVKNGIFGFSINDGRSGIKIMDLLTPYYYKTIMTFETPGNKKNITISNDKEYLYLSCGQDGIQIIGFHSEDE